MLYEKTNILSECEARLYKSFFLSENYFIENNNNIGCSGVPNRKILYYNILTKEIIELWMCFMTSKKSKYTDTQTIIKNNYIFC